MRKTVVIPAAGLGSRLNEFTKNYNKAMCTLGPKPVISYIIEKFDPKDEIIVLLGYKGDLLKQVLQICYPDRNIKFVNVDVYEGPGAGLGYSLSCAKELLQKPFIFWSNDSIIDENVNEFDYSQNFMVLSEFDKENADSYRHALIGDREVQAILQKGEYDKTGKTTKPYIGISFVKDFADFWKAQEDNYEIFVNAGESAGLNNLKEIRYHITNSWLDTGNKEKLIAAKEAYAQKMEATILEKPDEAIWFFDDRVVKFHIDPKFIEGRVHRFTTFVNDKMKANGIKIPELLGFDKNVYAYRKAEGKVMSKEVTPASFIEFVSKFLASVGTRQATPQLALDITKDFYKDKTIKRIEKYCKDHEDLDGDCVINGLDCYSAKTLMEKMVNWNYVASKAIISDNYHGDFHLENILVNETENGNEFIMLDWRQNFGKTYEGDIYYDIAKMWHSLIVNHGMVKDNLFSCEMKKNGEYIIDIHRTFIDTECEYILVDFLKDAENGYDVTHAKFLTALIFLNIAACHTAPYCKFLFYLGKYLMNKFIFENPEYIQPSVEELTDK